MIPSAMTSSELFGVVVSSLVIVEPFGSNPSVVSLQLCISRYMDDQYSFHLSLCRRFQFFGCFIL